MKNISTEIEQFIYKHLRKKHSNFYILGLDVYYIVKKSPSPLKNLLDELQAPIANNFLR
jgi:hypothetical protein